MTIPITTATLHHNFDAHLFKNLQYSHGHFFSHTDIVKKLQEENPYTITILIDTLKPEFFGKKKYMSYERIPCPSRSEELLLQYFFNEYGERKGHDIYAGYLKRYRSVWQEKTEYKNIDAYILRHELEPRYKKLILKRYRSWEKLQKSRSYIRRERYYQVPLPYQTVDWRNPYDTIFVWQDHGVKYFERGGSGSSGQRETNSRFIFAYSLINQKTSVPSYLFLYSDTNELLFIRKFRSLCVPGRDIGSNYHLSPEEEKRVLSGTRLLRWNGWGNLKQVSVE